MGPYAGADYSLTLYHRQLQRDGGPTFGDFVTIRPEASMQDVTFARLHSTRVHADVPLPLLINVMYCVRVSQWIVKIFLAQH